MDDVRQGRLRGGPETLQLNLTNACNLDCRFCWNHSPLVAPRSPAWHARRLSDAHLSAVLAALPRLRPDHVLLSGRGEPLAYPGIERLLGVLGELAIDVTIQTNGTIGPSPERLVGLGVGALHVDVSGATAEGYARVHPGRGVALYPRLVERLERFSDLGARLVLVAVITRDNASEIVALARWARALNVHGLYLKGLELAPGLEGLALDGPGRERVWLDLQEARDVLAGSSVHLDVQHLEVIVRHGEGQGDFTSGSGGLASPEETEDAGRGCGTSACYMGWYYLRITCDGEVMFCCKDKRVGHLDDPGGLYRLWRAPRYQSLRLAGRDGDPEGILFDAACARCSNFARNRAIARAFDSALE
ncbi:MAG: radical SAM protein [Deltaproteobacteria bacterium]|nr:radical SAM protein [Deltaproteobacteria bacterium]